MKILAINSTSRRRGTTTRLTESALEGAQALGAETEMILLQDCDIRYCRNCLSCYRDRDSEIAPCPLEDDVTGILEKLQEADGVILSSPLHAGFVSAPMVAFLERASFRMCRGGGGEILGLPFGGCPVPRREARTRALATIVSAGGMPPRLRKLCDTATPWLKDIGGVICNGTAVGDLYAGAIFEHRPRASDWEGVFDLRELTEGQLAQARALGMEMARTIRDGLVRPYRVIVPGGWLTETALRVWFRFSDPVETVSDEAQRVGRCDPADPMDGEGLPGRRLGDSGQAIGWASLLAGVALGGLAVGALSRAAWGRRAGVEHLPARTGATRRR